MKAGMGQTAVCLRKIKQFFSVAAQMEVEVVPMELKAFLAAEVEADPTAAGRARLQGSVPRVSQAHTASRARRTRTRENVAIPAK
jgi:hypothetical protein